MQDEMSAPKPVKACKYSVKLVHPATRVESCPNCGFPEADGGYCPECGWTHGHDCEHWASWNGQRKEHVS